jgi:hypothetical protein
VDVLDALVNHIRAAAREVVDDAADRLLVARNRARRQHDGVLGTDFDRAVVVDRDARQRRHRLALGSGGQAQHVLRGVAADFRIANLDPGGNAQIAEPLRDLRVPKHPAADECDFPIELRRQIHEDLHAVDARRERRHDQLAADAREDFLEGFDDVEFRAREAAAIDVGAVGEQRQHPFGPELREAEHGEMLAVDRRLVDLEVAGGTTTPAAACGSPAPRNRACCA